MTLLPSPFRDRAGATWHIAGTVILGAESGVERLVRIGGVVAGNEQVLFCSATFFSARRFSFSMLQLDSRKSCPVSFRWCAKVIELASLRVIWSTSSERERERA